MNTDKTLWPCHKSIYLSYLSYGTYSFSHSQVTLGVFLPICSERSLSDMVCDTIYTDNFYMTTVLPYTQLSVKGLQLSHKGSVLYHCRFIFSIIQTFDVIYLHTYTHAHTNTHTYIYIYIYIWDSVVRTWYSLDGSGIESRCRQDFPHASRPAQWPT
jgi:hypothetical protein